MRRLFKLTGVMIALLLTAILVFSIPVRAAVSPAGVRVRGGNTGTTETAEEEQEEETAETEETAGGARKALVYQYDASGELLSWGEYEYGDEDSENPTGVRYYYEDGDLMESVFFYYDEDGKLIVEEYYDEDDELLGTLEYEYEESGDKPDSGERGVSIGGLTKEELCEQVADIMLDLKGMHSRAIEDMACTVSEGGMTADLDMIITYDIEVTDDPSAAHILMDAQMEMMGMEMNQVTEVYSFVDEDGNVVTYTREIVDGEESDWEVDEGEEPIDPEEYLNISWFELVRTGRLDADLAPETVYLDGVECYRLDTVMSGDVLAENATYMMAGSDDTMFDLEDVDWDEIEANVTMYITVSDLHPYCMKMDCMPLAEMLLGAALGAEEDDSWSMEFTKFDMELWYLDYDIDEIEMPEIG